MLSEQVDILIANRMVSKHIIAVRDKICSGQVPTRSWITDYLGDIHNYLYLLEAVWQEQADKEIEEKGISEEEKTRQNISKNPNMEKRERKHGKTHKKNR